MIAINGRILENKYTTAQWAAITIPLPDRVLGYEVDSDGSPVGFKMGDGIHLWADLEYWGSGADFGSDKKYNAGTALPITMVNGTDFTSLSLRPIVNMVVSKNSTTDTNNGYTPVLVDYNFTNSSKVVLASITILDNGTGSLEFDSWFRVV